MQWPKRISWEKIKRRIAERRAIVRECRTPEGRRRQLVREGARKPFLPLFAIAVPLVFSFYAFYVRRPLTVSDVLEMPALENTILRKVLHPNALSVVFATPHWGGNLVEIAWDRQAARTAWGRGITQFEDGEAPVGGGSWKTDSGEANGRRYRILWLMDGAPPKKSELRPGEYLAGSAFFPELDLLVSYNGHREGREQFFSILRSIDFSERRQSSSDLYNQKVALPGILKVDPVPETQLVYRYPSNALYVLFRTEQCDNNRMVFWKPNEKPELTTEKWRFAQAGVTTDKIEKRTANAADYEILWGRGSAPGANRHIARINYLTADVFFPELGLRAQYTGHSEGKETFLKALDSMKILSGANAKEVPE